MPLPRAGSLDLLHDFLLGHVELVLCIQQALPADRKHLGDEQRIGLGPTLFELLPRIPLEHLVPRFSLLVAPARAPGGGRFRSSFVVFVVVRIPRERMRRRRVGAPTSGTGGPCGGYLGTA